jgi:curved DNA-binding protein CbpA
MRTLYEVLSVNSSSSTEEIRKRYLKLALLHHPDKTHSPESSSTLIQARHAYEVLMDAKRRAEYDKKVQGT